MAKAYYNEWKGTSTLRHLPHVGYYQVGSLVEVKTGHRHLVVEIDAELELWRYAEWWMTERSITQVVDLYGVVPNGDEPSGHHWRQT